MNRIFAGARPATAFASLLLVAAACAGAAAQDGPVLLTGLSPGGIDAPEPGGQLRLTANPSADDPAPPAAPTPAATGGGLALDVDVIAKELDIARQQIEPSLGASVYDFGRQAIATQPQGDNQPLNRLLLQAPGVTQDLFGQVHVRGDHANLQYRLNGIILPEGINVFGQALQTRLAQLGVADHRRVAGRVRAAHRRHHRHPDQDRHAGSGRRFTLYGGQQSTFQPSAEYGGTAGRIDYFVTGEVLHDAEGIENPAPTFNPIHDISTQPRGFGYVSGIIDPTTRVSSIFGVSRSEFQIPNNPGQAPGLGLTVDGTSDFDSALSQREPTPDHRLRDTRAAKEGRRAQFPDFDRDTLQQRLFLARPARRSAVQRHRPDRLAPKRRERSARRWQLSLLGREHDAQRFLHPARAHLLGHQFAGAGGRCDGIQTSGEPFAIFDSSATTGWLYSYYLQDEWRPAPKLTVNFGARFDQMAEYVDGRQLSPRVSLVWQPTDLTTFTVGYARYFVPPPYELIAPTTISLFANTTAAPTVTQDDRAKPERDHYFDASATQIILPGLKAGLDGYYKIASDLLDEGQFGAPIILTPFNYQKGLVDGVEATLSYDIGNWSFYGNLAASKALGKNIISAQFNFQPDELAYIANHYIHLDHDQTYTESAGAKYRFAKTGTLISADLTVGSGLRATTPGGIPNGTSLPGYQQVNLSIVQPVTTGIYKGLELRLDIINLLDQVYLIRNGTGVGVGAPQFGPRRTILAGVTQRF